MESNVLLLKSTENPFQILNQFYQLQDIPFLQKQREQVQKTQPYKGLKILHNIPLTLESLFKIENLLLGGADLTVTSPSFMQPKPLAIKILKQAKVNIQLESNFVDDFDFCLDCCGELLGKVVPRLGAVEITRTGSIQYSKANLDYPVISIDDCQIKNLEAILGTGEAFVRAFQELTGEDISDKEFLVIGYGKVGQGIAKALKKYTNKIWIAETNKERLQQAIDSGLIALDARNPQQVETFASRAFAVVTATGRHNVVSDCFDSQFFKGCYLANMGGEDEFGNDFTTEEVLCAKNPINFAIAEPTLIKYLDPVFYAHNLGIELILNSELKPGLHPFPTSLAEPIVAQWSEIFDETL